MGAKYHFDHREFNKVTDECKDLITKILVVDPKKRMTGEAILKHEWFKKIQGLKKGGEEDKLDAGIVNLLKNYKGGSKLKKAAMNILVKTLDSREINKLREQF